jgi:hypothetical protein
MTNQVGTDKQLAEKQVALKGHSFSCAVTAQNQVGLSRLGMIFASNGTLSGTRKADSQHKT